MDRLNLKIKPLLMPIGIMLVLVTSDVIRIVAAQFFDYWAKRPAFSGGYIQAGMMPGR